ncbi:MAG: hypothetical protein JKY08_00395 [Flavobacteriaceae bacterium]|nr:hypothetical protein [Flavobacteriaceae bacterium]
MKKITILFLGLTCCYLNAQQEKTKLLGTILFDSIRLANVHVINLNSKVGTISNQHGEFEMYAQLNDILYISAIQYEKVKIRVSNIMIKNQKIVVFTQPKTYKLEEIMIRNHHLTASIYHDILNKPKDTIPRMNVNTSDFKDLDFRKITFNNDAMSRNKPPSVEHLVNPISMRRGGGGGTIPNYQLIASRKLRKKLRIQKAFPGRIISDLGKRYFTHHLEIATDNIYHFLSYCESKDIVNLYQENKLLEVIKILRQEAITYKMLKKEEKIPVI